MDSLRGPVLDIETLVGAPSHARRAHVAATYLAAAGAVLEHFDPATSLQAIVDLAVPALADWCYIHLNTDGFPHIVAIAHADPAKLAAARARTAAAQPLSRHTAVARVLAGAPPELVEVDAAILEHAARDAEHLEALRAQGYRSAVVAPLSGRDGVLGAVTFAMADSDRSFVHDDLDMLVELARRTGSALDNARLFAAEQEARRHAEEARDRTRRLHGLTVALSGAIERDDVLAIMVAAGRNALGADGGFAWMLRDDTVELAASQYATRPPQLDQFLRFPIAAHLPVCDVIRTARPMTFESLEAMAACYPHLDFKPGSTPHHAQVVIPFVVAGRAIGALSFPLQRAQTFSADDRELLAAMTGQASLALERCTLIEAERRARSDAEAARTRERQLHVIAARLSSAHTPEQVAAITCTEVVAMLGAHSGSTSIRVGDEIHVLGIAGRHDERDLSKWFKLPLDHASPSADAVRTSELVWCANEAELWARYPHLDSLWRRYGTRSCGSFPFTFEGRTVGALAVSFDHEHSLTAPDREFLRTVGQVTAQALERARLYEALQRSEEHLRSALTAARAATWSLDVATMTSTRDEAYRTLVGIDSAVSAADFSAIHPDDREIARDQFERTLREGMPYAPEVRLRRDDGTYMWIRTHAGILHGPDGKPAVLAGVIVDIDDAKRASLRAESERQVSETVHRLGSLFARELDLDRLVQRVADEMTALVGAELGELFRAGADRGSFARVASSPAGAGPSAPGESELLAEAVTARRALRSADGSRLAVPVMARSGTVFGGLVFGHRDRDHFTEQHERLAAGASVEAAVALENARLYNALREHKEQLELAADCARLADRRKDEFLAMLGHELRNPLAPISTALELMELKAGGELQRERDVIRRQTDHLSHLIDDLLDVSRIARGKLQLDRQLLEISAVLAKAFEMASPLLERRMQRVAIDVARGLFVDADPTRLAQVFQNLITNAAKYSEPRTEIALRARADGDRVVVSLQDHGVGISPELMPRLFDLFVQGERALDRSEGGLGIGLTIAKRLCELHGGTIEAASAGPGRGSTFTVTLPRAAHATDAPAPATARSRTAAPVRVLVVDDNVDAAHLLHELLTSLGHESVIAHDGMAALELVASFQPQIAVLDIGLPGMDGYELARKLREKLGPAELRLIALTGYGQDSDRTRSHEAGFDHHLLKPISVDALLALLVPPGPPGP